MKQTLLSMVLILCINQCLSQKGFPKQFQTTLNISGLQSWQTSTLGVQKLLYDYDNLRVRFDIQGWRSKQNETYMIKYKPEGSEADSVSKIKLDIKKGLTEDILASFTGLYNLQFQSRLSRIDKSKKTVFLFKSYLFFEE